MSILHTMTSPLTAPLTSPLTGRGGGGFAPLSLFAGGALGAYWKPSDLSTVYQESTATTPGALGQPVGYIADLSGNGNHLTQATSGTRPVADAIGFNTASSKFLEASGLAAIFSGTGKPWSAHFVIKHNAAGSTTLMGVGSSASATPYVWLQFTYYATFESVVSTRNDANAAVTTKSKRIGNRILQVVGITSDGSLADLWINGEKAASGIAMASGAITLDRFALGCLPRNTNGYFGAASFGSSLVLNRKMTDAECAGLHRTFAIDAGVLMAPPELVDVYVVAGQSNAEGRGSSTTAGAGWRMDGAATETLQDPVGGALSGSAWPAFANKYYQLTGRKVVIIEAASGGTALLAAAGASNWSSTGFLRGVAIVVAQGAVEALQAAGRLGHVRLIWQQGEQDASAYNGTTVTDTLYQAEQEALFAYFFANITGLESILVSELGTTLNGVGASNYTLIRAAQNAAVAATANCHLAFTGAKDFAAQAKMLDNVHYNQTGLNEMGEALATYAAGLP